MSFPLELPFTFSRNVCLPIFLTMTIRKNSPLAGMPMMKIAMINA